MHQNTEMKREFRDPTDRVAMLCHENFLEVYLTACSNMIIFGLCPIQDHCNNVTYIQHYREM